MRILFTCIGLIFLILAVIGAMLPILPTTPFALLAAYFFSRSSPRLHKLLLDTPLLGQAIYDWEKGGSISLKSKATATAALLTIGLYQILMTQLPWWAKVAIGATFSAVLCFIWTRPNPKGKKSSSHADANE